MTSCGKQTLGEFTLCGVLWCRRGRGRWRGIGVYSGALVGSVYCPENGDNPTRVSYRNFADDHYQGLGVTYTVHYAHLQVATETTTKTSVTHDWCYRIAVKFPQWIGSSWKHIDLLHPYNRCCGVQTLNSQYRGGTASNALTVTAVAAKVRIYCYQNWTPNFSSFSREIIARFLTAVSLLSSVRVRLKSDGNCLSKHISASYRSVSTIYKYCKQTSYRRRNGRIVQCVMFL